MSDTTKKSVYDEFMEKLRTHGGMHGMAQQQLSEELKRAEVDKDHPLRKVVEARWSNNEVEAGRLLKDILSGEFDTDSPLNMISLFLVKLPRIPSLIQQAVLYTKMGNDEALSKMPLRIIQWAAMTVVLEDIKKSPKKQHMEWRALASEIRSENNALTDSDVARQILRRLSLPTTKIRNVRRVISNGN